MWVRFSDMSSGGHSKLHIGGLAKTEVYIEAVSEEAAVEAFRAEFGLSPYNVTCNCCGSDFSVLKFNTLEEASAHDRGCWYDYERKCYVESSGKYSIGPYRTLAEYRSEPNVIIRALPLQNPVTAPVSARVDSPPVVPAPARSAVERALAPTPASPAAKAEEPKVEEKPKPELSRWQLLEVD